MIKKCLALLVLFAMTIGLFPLSAKAQSERARILDDIRYVYSKVQNAVGRRDLSGLCGTMVGYQLYFLGINSTPVILDGKDQYDAYKDMEVTSGGHPVRAYSADDYSLREALYAVTNGGTKAVYNLLIGFQWTRSSAGRQYGHAVVVHAILDGVMYFCEAFNTPFDEYTGSPSVCTIDEFTADYGKWSVFEGVVLFGQRTQADFSQTYSSNAFLQTIRETEAKDEPGTTQSVTLRTVKRGERLEATGLYQNQYGEMYYSILDSGVTAYVRVEDVKVLSLRYDDVQILDATYPTVLKPGENFTINGTLRSTHNKVHNVMARIVDEVGQEQACFPIPVEGRYKDLANSALGYQIDFSHLYPGNYTLELSVEVRNHYVGKGKILTEEKRHIVEEVPFAVGYDTVPAEKTVASAATESGWQYADGVWRYYENGVYRTGWFCSNGVDYYLQEDGSAATGWKEINGQMRFFSNTGAMRTGWLDDNGAIYYLRSNGVPVTGQQTIDGEEHMFGTDGIWVRPEIWKK